MTPSEPRQTLPRAVRIRGKKDFDRIFTVRVRVSDARMTIYGSLNGGEFTRLGIAASRRLGSAVKRNRLKRRMREAFRRIRHELPRGLDLVVLPQPGLEPTVAEMQASLRRLAVRLEAKLNSGLPDGDRSHASAEPQQPPSPNAKQRRNGKR